jgi:hypothetical protein
MDIFLVIVAINLFDFLFIVITNFNYSLLVCQRMSWCKAMIIALMLYKCICYTSNKIYNYNSLYGIRATHRAWKRQATSLLSGKMEICTRPIECFIECLSTTKFSQNLYHHYHFIFF